MEVNLCLNGPLVCALCALAAVLGHIVGSHRQAKRWTEAAEHDWLVGYSQTIYRVIDIVPPEEEDEAVLQETR